MHIAVPAETSPGELRVSITPDSVARLVKAGHQVRVQSGAGVRAGFTDASFESVGAAVTAGDTIYDGAELVCRVQPPSADEIVAIPRGAALLSLLHPGRNSVLLDALAKHGVTALALELVPRITRAQSMDVLSSQSTVAGYKAVLIGASALPKFLPMLTTAAGNVSPAKVFVIGAGVAGLQAIATARRLGGVVSAFDVRPAAREQVQSLGASFLDLGVVGEETEGGYARELTPEEQVKQLAALEQRIPDFDVVITTAAIPGRPAPRLIPAAAVEGMRAGSVIVDLAAETGGNCELTEPGEVVERSGVIIVGTLNLPSTMPTHASQLYARNVSALLEHLAPGGELNLDWSDEITAGTCVTRGEDT
jgi:NAD(P) transhydrogenase subunit alpha